MSASDAATSAEEADAGAAQAAALRNPLARGLALAARFSRYVRNLWAPPLPEEGWVAPPIQVCPLCGATDRATREVTARSGFTGRARVLVNYVFTADFCPECGVRMASSCSAPSCGSLVRDANATCCWRCGRAYPWARRGRSTDWRHVAELIHSSATEDSRTVWLYVGDITHVRVDAVMSPDDRQSRMHGEVARRILNAAGDEAGQDVGQLRQQGDVWCTEAGGLAQASDVQEIIHVAAMNVDGSCSPEAVSTSTARALGRAADRHFKSIALPAIGTGSGGLDMREAATAMLTSIKEFLESDPGTVADIVCVVLDGNRAAEFERSATAVFRTA